MSQVRRLREYDVSAEVMWTRIGDFQAADTWHPAVVKSTPIAGGDGRELTLPDGAKILETRTGGDDRSYGYRIDESPLPVRDYSATIGVRDGTEGGCQVFWDAEFEPDQVSEAEAVAVVEGIFDAGLDAL